MNSLQIWVALLVVVVVALLAWLEQRRRDAAAGGFEFPVETLAPLKSATSDPDAELYAAQTSIVRLQHDNKVLWELLSVTLSHIKKLEREAEAETEAEGEG